MANRRREEARQENSAWLSNLLVRTKRCPLTRDWRCDDRRRDAGEEEKTRLTRG